MGKSFANGNGVSESGPWSPGNRPKWGYPPPAVSLYTLTGWADPE